MKKIMMTILTLGSLHALVQAACVINTNNLYFNDIPGARKVESILRAKGYQVVKEKDEASDFGLEVTYQYANGEYKITHMMIHGYKNDLFSKSVIYKSAFGITDGILERIHVVNLAKQIPQCP